VKYIVVGGGPSGLMFGNEIVDDFIIFEEHGKIGRPLHCTGLVSKEFVEEFSKNFVINKIRGAEIVLGKKSFKIGKNEYVAYVIDRENFEVDLFERIREKVILGKRVKNIFYKNNKIKLEIQGENYEGEFLIGADGPRSIVRKMVTDEKIEYINGVQALLKNKLEHEDLVKIYLDREYSKGFFAWAVPKGDDVLVGLGTYDRNPMGRLKKLIKNEFNGREIKEWIAGQIPIGELKKHYMGNIYLVGDAGLFVKATSGGGLFYGLNSSKILAISLKNNGNYERNIGWIKKELHRDLIIHKIFSKIEDREMEKIFNIISNEDVIEKINEYGHIDKPSIIAKKLIFDKNIIKIYPTLFKLLFR